MVVDRLNNIDISIYYSTKVDGLISYLGGQRTDDQLSDNRLHNFFQKTTDEEAKTGIIKFRCGYIFNESSTVYLRNPALFIVSDTSSPNDSVSIGWGSAAIGTGKTVDDDGSVEQALDTENDIPENVTFFDGNIRSAGAILNDDIPPRKGKPFWIKYESLLNAQDFPFDRFVVRCVSDNLVSTIPERTGPPPPTYIRFAVFGECSSDEDFTRLMSFIYPQSFDFIVTTGNNNVSETPSFFLQAMGTLMSKTILCFGWFDVQKQEVSNAYMNELVKYPFLTAPQKRYYSKTFGNVHFIVMDGYGQSYVDGSDQFNFVEKDLKDAYADVNIDWIFVVVNKSIYGSQTTSATRFQYEDFRIAYHEMFTKYGVLVVFQGTFNFYERTKVLKFNPLNTNQPQSFVYDGPDNYTLLGKKSFVDGQIYITVGTGGVSHDVVATPSTYSDFLDTTSFGYMKITCDNTLTNRKITFQYYSTSSTTQVYVEQFTISRVS